MTVIGAYEAKTHLPALLARVAKGETITITKHGVPIAMLVPAPETRRKTIREVIAAMRELRRGTTLGGTTIRELIEEGRRF